MNAQQIELTIRHYVDNRFTCGMSKEDQYKKTFVKQMCFGELKLSIQASEGHYCHPRENTDYYDDVEIGFPNFNFSEEFIAKYAEEKDRPQDTVYGYVPISEIAKELSILLKAESK